MNYTWNVYTFCKILCYKKIRWGRNRKDIIMSSNILHLLFLFCCCLKYLTVMLPNGRCELKFLFYIIKIKKKYII